MLLRLLLVCSMHLLMLLRLPRSGGSMSTCLTLRRRSASYICRHRLQAAFALGALSFRLGAATSLPGQLYISRYKVCSGTGVRAGRGFQVGESMILIRGLIQPRCTHRSERAFDMPHHQGHVLDMTEGNIVRYMNSGESQGGVSISNCRLIWLTSTVAIVECIKRIRRGNEALLSYRWW